jgi:deoxyribodipyrimidine photolyase
MSRRPPPSSLVIVWFRQDLRVSDHGALDAAASSGAPVICPVLQGEKFDPEGNYVRRWVPELAGLPSSVIHQPWCATPLELKSAGVELGVTYPEPIIDHKAGRERALAAYAKMRGNER